MSELTPKFELYNTQQTKQLQIVIQIEGVPGVFSSGPVYRTIRYGDPIAYGEGYVYGGLIQITEANGGEVRPWLALEGSTLNLTQRLEPEQGRGAVSMLSLAFIDKDGYMTQLCSPGFVVDDILGKDVTVFIGYRELSYPEDYFQVFRGKISGHTNAPGVCTLQLSDGNLARRQNIFFAAKTNLSGSINSSVTTIPVDSNSDFHMAILGPTGVYDPALRFYLQIEDEVIEYGPSFNRPTGTFGTNTFGNVLRGARGSVAAAHAAGTEVTVALQLEDHGLDAALKIMLSGWGGTWVDTVPVLSFRQTLDPVLLDQPNAIIFPQGVDAVREYNLQAGDQIIVTGGVNAGTYYVVSFETLFSTPNRIVYVDQPLVLEYPTVSTLAFRSQYDVYPITCGSKLKPIQVDIERHLFLKQTFLGADENSFRFFINSQAAGKSFIETQLYLPLACYSLTRFGRLSVGLTKPPIADERLTFLNEDNIINPQEIRPNRSLNNRRFFNEVTWNFDKDDAGEFRSQIRTLDTESISIIGISSVLPISSDGGRTDLGIEAFITRRNQFLLSRYKRGAIEISPKINFEAAMLVEAGDVVALEDNGALQIANLNTGQRDLGVQLFEVTERNLDLRTGHASLKLTSGVGGSATDRFGVISPSSLVGVGSTTSEIIITDSYGILYPGDEKKKWENYIGERILVHDINWAYEEETVLLGFDPGNAYRMLVDPPLTFSPVAGNVVDIINYPTDVDPYASNKYKAIHCFLDPAVPVVTGVSNFIFSVAPADIGKFALNQTVLVHESEWTVYSPEVKVTDVDTGTNRVTVGTDLGFTPVAGYLVELIGFPDGGQPYRWI